MHHFIRLSCLLENTAPFHTVPPDRKSNTQGLSADIFKEFDHLCGLIGLQFAAEQESQFPTA